MTKDSELETKIKLVQAEHFRLKGVATIVQGTIVQGDRCPRRKLSKGLLSNDTVVQADFCPRRLLSKEVFTSKKLAQIDFTFFLLRLTIQVCKKNTMSSFYFK